MQNGKLLTFLINIDKKIRGSNLCSQFIIVLVVILYIKRYSAIGLILVQKCVGNVNYH